MPKKIYTEEADNKKRKTHTSSEVKKRYNDKTYVQYAIKLRKIDDSDIIELIETEKNKGYGTSEAIKNLIKVKKDVDIR